jgi:hypothetical protein
MGVGVALSQVQALARENAALRQERDSLIHQLAVLDGFLTVLREQYPCVDFGAPPGMARDTGPACLGPIIDRDPDAKAIPR